MTTIYQPHPHPHPGVAPQQVAYSSAPLMQPMYVHAVPTSSHMTYAHPMHDATMHHQMYAAAASSPSGVPMQQHVHPSPPAAIAMHASPVDATATSSSSPSDETANKKQRLETGNSYATSHYNSASSVHASIVPYASDVVTVASADIVKPRRAAASSSSPRASPVDASAGSERGPGMPIGDIPVLTKRLEKVSNEDPRTKFLHTICFPFHTGPIAERMGKRAIRAFSGYNEDTKAKARERAQEYEADLDLLRKVNRLLDLPSDGTGAQLIDTVLKYMDSPHIVEKPVKEETEAAPRKRAPKAKSEQKRPPNPYLLFATDHREEVVAASPGLAMMEINRLLGQLWSRAPEETKTKYKRLADEAKLVWERDHPELAAAAKAGLGSGKKRKRSTAGETAAAAEEANISYAGASDGDSDMSDSAAAAHQQQRRATPSAPMSGSSHASPAPPTIDHELAARLASSIQRLLSTADLNVFSLRQVKSALSQEFSEKVVRINQKLISDLVDKELLAMP